MTISNIKITASNKKQILDYLAINHPNYKILNETEYSFLRNGRRYNSDVEMSSKSGKTIQLELEGEGLTLELPIELLRKPATSVIPVYITEEDCVNIEVVFNEAMKQKVNYGAEAEKVTSFQNFEIRNGKVIPRSNRRIMDAENIIIVKA